MEEVDALEAMASRRLTAAMIGLLRSFTVHSFAPNSEEGLALLRAANQNRSRDKEIVAELHASLAQVRAGLLDVTLGSGGAEALDNEGHLFECGWSWGVVADAPRVEIAGSPGQPEGLAPARPFLY
nr:hypothetical protein [Micromonospora sp. DSM 115978]